MNKIKNPMIYDQPQEWEVRKYYHKYTRGLSFPFKNAFRNKVSTVTLGKRFKRCFSTKCHTRDKTRLILKGVKQIFRSFALIEPSVIIPIKLFRNIKRFHFSTSRVRGWRYFDFVARMLTKLRFEFNPVTKYDIEAASTRTRYPPMRKILAYQRSVLKRNVLLLNKVKFMELDLYLDEDQLPLLQLLEKSLPALPNMENIELMVASHRTKVEIMADEIPNLIARVHNQRVFASDNVEQVNNVFPGPELFKSLKTLTLHISSPTGGSYGFFQCLEKMYQLKSLEISMTDPTWDTLQDFFGAFSIPETVQEFTFGFSQPWKDFTELIFENEEFVNNRPVTECPARFHRFIEQIHNCKKLKYLKVEWACSKNTPVFTNFFRGICSRIYNVEQLFLQVRDTNMDDELIDIKKLEEAVRFDEILASNPRLLESMEIFDLNVPGYALENLPENLVINEKIAIFSVTGKQLRTGKENSLIPLIKILKPKESFKIMIGGDDVQDFDVYRNMINHFLAIPNLYCYVYEFKTKLDRMNLFSVIKEFVNADVKVFLRFSATHYLDTAYIRAFEKFLRQHGRAGTIQCFSDATIVSWRPIKK